MQLQSYADQFTAAGIGVVVITYDSPELQQAFIDKFSVTYPLLSDVDASSIIELGILNEEYGPGDPTYGIPHPGIFIIDTEQHVVDKIFLEAYDMRVEAAAVLGLATTALNAS